MGSLYYLGVTGSVFHYVSHGTGKALLFMAAGSIIMQTGGVRSIKKLGGLGSKLPITGIAAMIGFLAIVGVPPTNGFQSEWLIFAGSFAGALETGSTAKLVLTAIALAGTPITAASATEGCSSNADSTSNGPIRYEALIMTSSARPTNQK